MGISEMLGLPDVRPKHLAWGRVERELGTALPEDYKRLVEKYPELVVGGFIRILQPNGRRPSMDIVQGVENTQAWLEHLAEEAELEGDSFPYVAYPEAGGLLRWGVTINGDYCFWRAESKVPDDWECVISEDKGDKFTSFPGGVEEFLCAFMARPDSLDVFHGVWGSGGPMKSTFRT